jgi:glycogen debranching enzyme
VLKRQRPDGRLPSLAIGRDAADRHMPPLMPLAVWYLCHDGDWDYADRVLPALARAHHRLLATREPRRDGLLSWGNDRPESPPLGIPGWAGAAYESGMDNSPMWEELGFDEQNMILGRASVDLCSLAALSARVLAAINEHTGGDPGPYQQDYRRIAGAVNDRLWGQDGLYHNMNLHGSLATRVSPTSFYPMAAGLCPRDRGRQMIQRHLRCRESFWGHPVIPSVPRDSWLYDGDGDYWRGRIWPPMNYLVWAGLRQYNPGEAVHLGEHSRLLFDAEWERHRHVHENYSAATGNGEGRPGTYARSCKLYCWGGLLLLSELESKVGGAIVRLPSVE